MSVINKMLQELDRRNATAGSQAEQAPQQVKAIVPPRSSREWFWRLVATLMLAAVAWVAWVAFQLQPRPSIATEQAFRAAEKARTGSIRPAAPAGLTSSTSSAASPSAPTSAPSPSISSPAAPPAPSAQPVPAREPADALRLAQSIETPIPERPVEAAKPQPAKREPQKQVEGAPQEKAKPEPRKPAPPAMAARAPAKPVVDKRNRARPGSEIAEAHFRRAAVFLNQGRVSEAEDQLVGALQSDPTHVPARQAYVSLLLEQQRMDAAKRVLRESVASNPGQPTFALALARILAEQRDYAGAPEVMDRAGSVARNADFLALRGAVFQRMGRHAEAVEAYQASVQGAAQPGTTWVGYGISLEAVGRKADAGQAYRRSLGAGLAREVREYVEGRIRALE